MVMESQQNADVEKECQWECHACGRIGGENVAPYGWIANHHPLCKYCADLMLWELYSKENRSLSYHYSIGEVNAYG